MKVVMSEKFKNTTDWFSSEYQSEIAGFIVGEISPDGIQLEDLLFPEQEAGVASVDMSPKQLAKLRKEYGNRCAKIVGEWHSHHNMGASWSGTDEKFITEFMTPREVGIFVVSSKGEHLVRVELRKPISLSMDNVGYEVISHKDDELEKELRKIIKSKVTEHKYVATYSYGGASYGGYSWGGNHGRDDSRKEVVSNRMFNKRLGDMVSFHNDNTVVISGIGWEIADTISDGLEGAVIDCMSEGDAQVKVKFKDKETALKTMKTIKEELRCLLEEQETFRQEGVW